MGEQSSDAPARYTVTEAITKVMHLLPGIGRDQRSPEGYQYRGIEAITQHLQPLLAEYGIVIVPALTIDRVVASPAMKEGWQDVFATVRWTIYGPDGSSITAQTCGVGRDKSDKGSNKAQTQAFKYLLLALFAIADKADDVDGVTYESERDTTRRESPRAATSSSPAPTPAPAPDPDLVALLELLQSDVDALDMASKEDWTTWKQGHVGWHKSLDTALDARNFVMRLLEGPLEPPDDGSGTLLG